MQMVRAIWVVARKDITVWLCRPTNVAATVMPSLVFFIIIVLSAQAVGRNPVAVVDLSKGPESARLLTILHHSDAFVPHDLSPQAAQQALAHLEVAAVITIPAQFDIRFAAHRVAPVDREINNLNLDFTNDLRRALPTAITRLYAEQPNSPIHIAVAEHDLRAQDVSLAQFELVPELVLLITVAGVVNSGLATAREWEEQTIKELLLAPVPRWALIAGKLLGGVLMTLAVTVIAIGLGVATNYLRPAPQFWPEVLGTVLLLSLASVGIGVALGALLRRLQPSIAVGILIAFYLFFLSGGIGAVAFLPNWVQEAANFTPTYYGVHALQMAIFYSATDHLARDLAVLTVTAIVTLLIGIQSLRRRTLV